MGVEGWYFMDCRGERESERDICHLVLLLVLLLHHFAAALDNNVATVIVYQCFGSHLFLFLLLIIIVGSKYQLAFLDKHILNRGEGYTNESFDFIQMIRWEHPCGR
uniref:Uncharacterized protein n=1 Tax=Cyclophora tenuis TaxID=216820 RepID=A0A7S1CXF9_CYCTE